MNFYDKHADKAIYFGNLPHLRQTTVGYFVTFRTADSIPQVKLKQWTEERNKWLSLHPEPLSDEEMTEYSTLFTRRMEKWLDRGYGECLLKDPRCQEVVKNAMLFFHQERYALWEYTVSLNHVHIIIEPFRGWTLGEIMHSFKSFTAKEINKLFGRSGQFWQKEYFDHIIRSEFQLNRFIKYIQNHERSRV